MRNLAWLTLAAVACTKDTPVDDTSDTSVVDVPSIADALDCGTVGPAGGIGAGTALQRVNLDTSVFPDALCNDGTPGFFYFRPAATAQHANDWVIQLQGGGSCNTGASCFQRWCSVDTNFGMQGMTADASPQSGIIGAGILQADRQDNPLGDFNHVFVRYCSSDAWVGQRGDVVVTAPHPVTGEDVTAKLQFRGYDIVTAVISTLRQDGVTMPAYTIQGGSDDIADLDDAVRVVLAGGSAGGNGTITHADRLGAVLQAHAPHLEEYGAIVDSAFGPSLSHLQFGHTELCTSELHICDYETYMRGQMDDPRGEWALYGEQPEDSCKTFHTSTDDVWRCADNQHVLEHHVTTPFLVRMGQNDELVSSGYLGVNYYYQDDPLDAAGFASLVREDLAAAADPAGNEEAASYEMSPAAFGPTCSHHENLSNNAQVFDVSIDDDGTDTTMFQLLGQWRGGRDPAALIATDASDNTCFDD